MGYAPLVSVIVPVYKTEKFIHRCIDSVLNQTYSIRKIRDLALPEMQV